MKRLFYIITIIIGISIFFFLAYWIYTLNKPSMEQSICYHEFSERRNIGDSYLEIAQYIDQNIHIGMTEEDVYGTLEQISGVPVWKEFDSGYATIVKCKYSINNIRVKVFFENHILIRYRVHSESFDS